MIDIDRTISVEEMFDEEGFCFGKDYENKSEKIFWNPDSISTQNAHLMIVGASGSGKTRLLVNVIEYLRRKNKQVYIIDFHGDIETKNETKYIFKARHSEYGINFFNFSKDSDNGGPVAHSNVLIAIFKKNFIPNMGAIQKGVLKQLIIDCYRYVGIFDEDEITWEKELPKVDVLREVYSLIISRVENFAGGLLLKEYAKANKLKVQLKDLNEGSEEYKKIRDKIDKQIGVIENSLSHYLSYLADDKNVEFYEGSHINNIELDFYMEQTNIKALKSLAPYLKELHTSSVFNDNKPPKASGIVRYDISGFTNIDKPLEAMFFADITMQEIFRNIKLLGEYKNRSDSVKAKFGEKCSTFIVIDESKLILPTGKDKENPFNILNRIVSEARKFGLGLIIVSQRPEHFSDEMLSSIYTKVVLKIDAKDEVKAIKSLGVKPDYLFSHIRKAKDGVCIVGNIGGLYKSVATPWLKF